MGYGRAMSGERRPVRPDGTSVAREPSALGPAANDNDDGPSRGLDAAPGSASGRSSARPGPLRVLSVTACVFVAVGALSSAAAMASPPLIGPLVAPDVLVVALPALSPEESQRIHESLGRMIVVGWLDVTTRIARAAQREVAEIDTHARFYDPPTEEERRLVEVAVYHCDNAGARHAKPYVMLELLRTEEEFGVPSELRGVTLAAWCGEASYQIEDVVGDGGAAVGILQLHPELTQFCGSPDLRHDPIASAQCWLWNLRRIHAKARRRCPSKHAWRAAELWLSQGGAKSNYACERVSSHVARLDVWRQILDREVRLAGGAPP